jgi:hypothetical protein
VIAHAVAFTWTPETTEADVAGVTVALGAMAAALPFLVSYECGPNLRLRPSEADFGVLAVVRDAADLERYLDGPEHAEVQRAWLGRMIARRVSMQLDLSSASALINR